MANALLTPQMICAELLYLITHEINSRHMRLNTFRVSKSGFVEYAKDVRFPRLNGTVQYEFPWIGGRDMLLSLPDFTTKYLIDAGAFIGEALARRSRMGLITFSRFDIPKHQKQKLDWAESPEIPEQGICFGLFRAYDMVCDLMHTELRINYSVS